MKTSRRPKLIQGGLVTLLLVVLAWLAWQHYHQPASLVYEGKTLEQWLEDLDDPDYHVNERAADVFIEVGPEAVPILLDACERGGIRLHRRSVAVLARIGAPAAPRLAAALQDKAKRGQVEVALVRLGPAAVPALREALTEEKGGEAAAHILGLIGPRAADAVPDLIALLNQREAATALRGQAAFALGRIDETSAAVISTLTAALTDDKKEVRDQAVAALGWIGPAAREARTALAAVLKDDEAMIAIRACQALSFIGDAGSAPALLAAFESKRPEVAAEAGRALWRLGPKADPIVPALLSAAQGPLDKSASARSLLASFGPRVVPLLMKALSDSEPGRREAAADMLGRIGPPARPAVPALLAALKDKSSAVALMAAMALAEIDPTRSGAAVKLLTDACDVPGAVFALANIGPNARAAVPALIAALKPPKKNTNRAELIRTGARLALARIGKPAVPALIEALKEKKEGVAPMAGDALGWILPPPEEAVPALRSALQNDRPHAAVYVHALGQLGPVARPAVPDLTALLKDAEDRPEAAAALVRIDPHQAKKVVPILIDDLQAKDEKQQQAAALALANLGSAAKPAAGALAGLLHAQQPDEAAITILALREIGAGAIPSLVGLLKDPSAEFRQLALRILAQLGPSARQALPALIQTLSDQDNDVRVAAAHVLEQMGSQASEAVPALIPFLYSPRMPLRYAAAVALGTIGAGSNEARRPLLECLLDPDENVRYAAALALGRIDPHFTEAAPALRDAWTDSSPMVQLAAIDSLNHIDRSSRKDSVPLLIALGAKPNDLQVRFRAVEGLYEVAPDEAKQAVPWLSVQLTVVDSQMRFLFAARVLARIDPSQSSKIVLALAAALRPLDVVGNRRQRIVRTLGEFGPKAREVVPEIERLLYDGTPGVRAEAIRALKAINPERVKQLGLD